MDTRVAFHRLRHKTVSGTVDIQLPHSLPSFGKLGNSCVLKSLFVLIKKNPQVNSLALTSYSIHDRKNVTEADRMAIIEGLNTISSQIVTLRLVGDFGTRKEIIIFLNYLLALPIPNIHLSIEAIDVVNLVIGKGVRTLSLPGTCVCNKPTMKQLVGSNLLQELHLLWGGNLSQADMERFLQHDLPNTRLKTLSLSSFPFPDDLASVLCKALSGLPLNHLSLDSSLLKFTNESYEEFANYLKSSNLRALSLKSNHITREKFVPIMSILEECALQSLDLGFNELASVCLLELVTILPKTKIRDLKNVFINVVLPGSYVKVIKKLAEVQADEIFFAFAWSVCPCDAFVQAIADHYPKLIRLGLNWCEMDVTCCHILSELLNTSRLQELSLKNAKITNESCLVLARLLKRTGQLKVLALPDNQIGTPGMDCLLQALSGSAIQELNFQHNPITDDMVKLLMRALPRLPLLQKIDLFHTGNTECLDPESRSVDYLVQGLRGNTSLQEMYLWRLKRVEDILRLFGCKGHVIAFNSEQMNLLIPHENKIDVLTAFADVCSTRGAKHSKSVFGIVPIEIVRLIKVMLW